jgi:hypothetical protein
VNYRTGLAIHDGTGMLFNTGGALKYLELLDAEK